MHAFALFFLLACGGSEEAAAPEAGGEAEAPAAEAPAEEAPKAAFDTPAEIDSAMTICMGAVDCVAVQLTCCCEDDGWIAVNKSNAEAAKDKYGQKDCDAAGCAEGDCAAPEATCQGGCKLAE